MARSMTIKQEEKPTTSPLFNIFFLLAVGWMALAAITSANAEADGAMKETAEEARVASPDLP